MSDTETQIISPTSQQVSIADETFQIRTFKTGKMLLVLEAVTQLLEGTSLKDLLTGGVQDVASFMPTLIGELPTLLRVAGPVLDRAVGLAVTPDKDLLTAEEAGDDPRVAAEKLGHRLVALGSPEEVIEVLSMGITAMGLDRLKTALPKLTGALGL